MNYFKDSEGNVYAYEDDQLDFIKPGLVELSELEIDKINESN